MGTTNETAFKPRSNVFSSMKVASVASPGLTAGQMFAHGSLIAVAPETYATGDEGVAVYKCEKIELPKVAGSSKTISAGAPVYFDTATSKLVSAANKSSADSICGICLVDAAANDTTVLVDFDGSIEALN